MSGAYAATTNGIEEIIFKRKHLGTGFVPHYYCTYCFNVRFGTFVDLSGIFDSHANPAPMVAESKV